MWSLLSEACRAPADGVPSLTRRGSGLTTETSRTATAIASAVAWHAKRLPPVPAGVWRRLADFVRAECAAVTAAGGTVDGEVVERIAEYIRCGALVVQRTSRDEAVAQLYHGGSSEDHERTNASNLDQ